LTFSCETFPLSVTQSLTGVSHLHAASKTAEERVRAVQKKLSFCRRYRAFINAIYLYPARGKRFYDARRNMMLTYGVHVSREAVAAAAAA